jgi:hypothetical protein
MRTGLLLELEEGALDHKLGVDALDTQQIENLTRQGYVKRSR